MELKISIVEDEWLVAEDLAEKISALGYEVDLVLTSPENVLLAITNYSPDLVVLDINLQGKLDGIQLAEKIKEEYPLPIIFLTGYEEGQIKSFSEYSSPHAYLVKPFSGNDLNEAINSAVNNFYNKVMIPSNNKTSNENQGNPFVIHDAVFVNIDQSYHKIRIEDILYLKEEGSNTKLITVDDKFTIAMGLDFFLEQINLSEFLKVHPSIAVNILKIDKINPQLISLNGHEIPVGKSYRNLIFNKLQWV